MTIRANRLSAAYAALQRAADEKLSGTVSITFENGVVTLIAKTEQQQLTATKPNRRGVEFRSARR
jgi:hypothetical protein